MRRIVEPAFQARRLCNLAHPTNEVIRRDRSGNPCFFVVNKSARSGRKDRWQSGIGMAIRCCFVLLIGVAFANQQVFALSIAQKSRLGSSLGLSESGQKLSPAGVKVTYPSDAESNESESIESDECQSGEEKSDNEFTESPIASSVNNRIAVSSAALRLLIDQLGSGHRTETSLYILYHSWKSFLY